MAPNVSPSLPAPTHHVSLSDGTTTYGLILSNGRGDPDARAISRDPIQRTSLKMSQGSTKYSDFSEPFTPVAQSDWSGGRGLEDFENDRSRFYDSYRCSTWMAGGAILGPQEFYATGLRNSDQNMPGNVTWQALTGSQQYLAASFSASASYTTAKGYIWIRRVGTPNGNIHLGIFNDSAGDPGTSRTSTSISPSTFGTDTRSVLYEFDYADNALTSGTTYHIKAWAASGSDNATNHWEIGVNNASGNTKQSSDDSSWASASIDLYYRIVDADDDRGSLLFIYKQALYCVTQPEDGSAAQLFLNGDRGTADSNSGALTTLVDATKSWTTNEWTNAVAVLTAGTGSEEITPWRVISSNTGTALTVSPAWNITHDTTTEYVIIAADKWQEITGTGLTKPATDVLVSKDVVYFAQGDSTNIRRFQGATSAGVWTRSYADDGTNKATFLELIEDPVSGQQVWKANNDSSSEVAVARADAKAWGTNLTFGSDIVVGTRDDRITGLERYGTPSVLWVLKEASVWSVQNDIPDEIPLRELASVESDKNGKAHLVHGVYLYFSLLHSLQRYYRNNLDDKGPSQDAGLPSDRQGPIVDMVGYPGIFFAAIDGGTSNYSSILVYNQFGWHELYRGPVKGKRIRNLQLQVIPGSTVDRLWFSEGTDIAWIPFPSDTLSPFRDSNYRFTHEGHIITSWMYANLQDVQKLFKSFKVFAENLSASNYYIEADYQTDGDADTDAWNAISGDFDTVPVEEIDLSSSNNVTGRRIRFRIRLLTNDATKTPKLKATVAEMLPRISTKFRYSMTFKAQDNGRDLLGDKENYGAVETLVSKLDSWANAPTVLTLRCTFSPYDNKNVLLDPSSLRPFRILVKDGEEVHLGQISLDEI